MMQTKIIPSYLYTQYQNDPNLGALVQAYNQIAQAYLTYLNGVNMPVWSSLSGTLLDWIGTGYYGYPRPIIAAPTGAGFGIGVFNEVTFNQGSVSVGLATDDIYQRILTWKMYRGDGYYMNINWLKRRIMRFLLGTNGTTPVIDNTYPISVVNGYNNGIVVTVNYPSDPTSVNNLIACFQTGLLDLPFQYNFQIKAV